VSIRSVDMQHTLQQVAAAERVQAVDKGQAEQQGQQFAQKLERAEIQREHSVTETPEPEDGRIEASNPEEQGQQRRRRRRGRRLGEPEPPDDLSDGEIHLIDVRA
jgi:hypothetical protein